jgi:hypothetical protein
MQLRPVNFPVEDGQLLTQGEILCRERCTGDDQAPGEQKESGDEYHKCEANHRKEDKPDDRAEWLMLSLTASISTRDEVFGRNTLSLLPHPQKLLEMGDADIRLCRSAVRFIQLGSNHGSDSSPLSMR